MVCYSEAVLSFAQQISQLQDHRKKNKLWFPTGLRKIGNLLKGGKGNSFAGDQENPDQLEDVADDDATEVSKGESDKDRAAAADKAVQEAMADTSRDPDARPPHGYQKLTINIHHFGLWLKKPETIFALRFAFVSIVLWLPR